MPTDEIRKFCAYRYVYKEINRYPHLDLGDFARTPHSKHLCGNCGRNNTWSKGAISSTPRKPIHDQFSKAWQYIDVDKVLNIDECPGCNFAP
jgi:hypothetical protein